MTVVFMMALAAHAAAPPSREDRVAAVIARYAGAPPILRVLLQPMPKGGDLHNHLDGSVYAEDYLTWASDDGDCIARTTRTITPPPCTAHQVPARDLAARDPKFYQETIDALSMRNFVPGLGTGEVSGHDHTFATFGRFGAVAAAHLGDMLAATRRIAARDNVQYIEQIADPSAAFDPALFPVSVGTDRPSFERDLAALSPRLPGKVAAARAQFDAAEARMHALLRCDDPPIVPPVRPACRIDTHYLFFVLRTLPPQKVFAQIALGYALVAADPRFVGLDLVGPEDDPVALRDFALQMRMFQFFEYKHTQVKLSLHAGELALGLVPPDQLGFHIYDSIFIAGATRIGHGYEMPYYGNAAYLLGVMARAHIAVEINLTSNDITPGVRGAEHPLALYRAAGVPVTLSADDEGVFRIDLTHEYVRAVAEQHLDYRDLKEIARNGLEYSFLPGESLWIDRDYAKPVAACAHDTVGTLSPSDGCIEFLVRSQKATLQWRFEHASAAYEDAVLAGPFARP